MYKYLLYWDGCPERKWAPGTGWPHVHPLYWRAIPGTEGQLTSRVGAGAVWTSLNSQTLWYNPAPPAYTSCTISTFSSSPRWRMSSGRESELKLDLNSLSPPSFWHRKASPVWHLPPHGPNTECSGGSKSSKRTCKSYEDRDFSLSQYEE